MLRIMTSVHWLRQERDMLHQSVCCKHIQPSAISDGVLPGCVQVGAKWRDIRWRWSEDQWCNIVRCFLLRAIACNAWDLCRVFFYLPTMQYFCCCSPSVRDSQPSGMRDTCVYFITPLATQQYRSEPTRTQNMGRNAATGLPSSWRRWTEAALNRCLAWFWAKCHQRRRW